MNQLSIPSEISETQDWLSEDFYKITAKYKPDNLYIISALTERDGDVYELNIECNYERDIALITMHCLKEITPEKYFFCIELLNSLNNHNTVKFSLNPNNMRISCSLVVGFANWEVTSHVFPERLCIYSIGSVNDLSKLVLILNEDQGLVEATKRILGDV